MIRAALPRGNGFTQRLLAKASLLARAGAKSALLTSRGDASRWRRADLLWPLFSRTDR